MSALAKDLPDPLDQTPTLSTSDPDELLSKMADEAIDRLMADADRGKATAGPPPPSPTSDEAVAAPADAETPGSTEGEPVAVPVAVTPAGVPAEVAARAVDVPSVAEAAVPAALVVAAFPADRAPLTDVGSSADPEPSADRPAPPHRPAAGPAPSPAPDRQALLADPTPPVRRPSVLLLPLRVINAPFGWVSEGGRRVFGLLGILTLVPSACVIVYLVWLKHRWGG